MRIELATLAILLTGLGSAGAGEPRELVTAPDAILCMSADNLAAASIPAVATSQTVLRAMGCLRSQAGIRIRVVRDAPDGSWQVRFYPDGISGGVVLWGKPEAFTAGRGARLAPIKRI